MKKLFLLLITLFILVLGACSDITIEPEAKETDETINLANVDIGYKERLEYLRKSTYKETKYRGILDGLFLYNKASVAEAPMDDSGIYFESSAPNSIEGETSKTNVIVEGIDEAYTIKNDDRYIYYVKSWNDSDLLVVDTLTDEAKTYDFFESTEDSHTYISGMYLTDKGLIVLAYKYKFNLGTYYRRYNYDKKLIVLLFDNTNPLDLKEKDRWTFENAYLEDSRMIDNKLILVQNVNLFKEKEIQPVIYEFNSEKVDLDYSTINVFNDCSYYGDSFTNIVTIDFETDEVCNKGFYGISSWETSVSFDNIYLISRDYRSDYLTLYRVSMKDGLKLTGEIKQKGWINDLYSINEYNGVLRIATTYYGENGVSFHDYGNIIATYDITEDKNELLNQMKFAAGERIYSASFNGDLGYVVTYLYIDPLFEFDLSNPKEIKLLRQLESPGVSDYLDYINEDFILGIGRATTVHGEEGEYQYATTDGVKLSLFSLDQEEMKEEYTYVFDYEYSSTDAQYNHKSIIKLDKSLTYFIPFYGYNYTTNNNRNYRYESVSGICGFRVDKETRTIKVLGIVDTGAWSNDAVVVNGKLYAVSSNSLMAIRVTDSLNVYKTFE